MKKIIYSILAVTLLASCSKSQTSGDDSDVISLRAGVSTVMASAKAPIVSGSEFTAAVAGWEHASAATYTDAPTWQSTALITANSIASNITLDPVRSYNSTQTTKTFMKAWYPAGTLLNGVVTFATPDGTQDVMITDAISGSKADKTGKSFTFNHKTTQFKFMVVKGLGLAAGTEIKSIEIVNAELPASLSLMDNSITYTQPANLAIPNLTAAVIGETSTKAGDAVMVKSQSGNVMQLNIVTSKTTYTGVTVTIDTDTDFVVGRAYTITLTFGQSGILPTASVADWTPGTGSGAFD